MFAVMGVAFAALLLLAICRMQETRIQASVAFFIVNGLFWVRLALGLMTAAAVAVCVMRAVRGKKEEDRIFTFPMLTGMLALLFGASLLFPTVFYTGLMVYVGAAFLLYAIYCIYHNGFFIFTLLMAAGAAFLYAASLPAGIQPFYEALKFASKILAVVLPLAVGITVIVLKRRNGKVKLGGRTVLLLEKEDFLSLIVGAAVLLVGALLVLFFGGLLRPVLLLVLATFLAFTILYTVKLV